MKKTRQQMIDEKAIRDHKAVGANNPGGQAFIAPQRFVPGAQDDANDLPRKRSFRGIRVHDEDNDTWGLSKVPRYEE